MTMRARELLGHHLLDRDGSDVGRIKQVYFDDETQEPKWVTVHTGLLGMRESFVPLRQARMVDDKLQVPFDKQTIKDAPSVDADEHISPDEEAQVYRHYGLPRPRAAEPEGYTPPSDAGRPGMGSEQADRSGPMAAGSDGTADMDARAGTAEPGGEAAAMPSGTDMVEDRGLTRSEERMRIGMETQRTGRVRLRRFVDTEEVERTVPVHRQEVHVRREPIGEDERPGDAVISEGEEEVITYRDHPVVMTETVPVERVTLETEDVVDEETVRGRLRKERIEVEEDDGPDRPA
ncbi:PRC and DUF2382 domain-containing protein [Allonocardiopsis opalescens]|uniref:PRC-barrel domain protein n=1 Tax=Allonocardiopsis opalescens TaxID=1144618 RepID=A0A2T0Q806_9ACTN|nr:PRC and DUF2382 domain-containing protein [Allonocardiopsis opalescens]PRX99928.1 PRC-barrel domain protein [Allonocardiopsis opalescens]